MAAPSLFVDTMDYPMVYDGSMELYYECKYWAMTQLRKVRYDEVARKKMVALIVDLLRQEAYSVAKDLGCKALFSFDGIPKLVKAMKVHAFAKDYSRRYEDESDEEYHG